MKMGKIVDSTRLDRSKLRDLAGSLDVLVAKSLELKPILESLSKIVAPRQVITDMRYRTEGGVSVLERDLAALQAALEEVRGRIKPALKTLKNSLH